MLDVGEIVMNRTDVMPGRWSGDLPEEVAESKGRIVLTG